ncbi:nucleotidyltransferase family protein [Paenibacillus humicola]|uniref:nucleotidyltransferase domain-containing protein n=1 Tax=Paenibacillus humicola TaxID=3110540 RepID=UPI00237BFC3A|nr:nucleotidyltransferase family protein [Paenibacillus humicola]
MVWKLLHALYNEKAPFPVDSETLDASLDDIGYFRLEPQVYRLLSTQNKLERLPDAHRERLKTKFDESVMLNVYIQFETERLFHAFESRGIDVIPLKGVRFAAKYFGHIGARSTSDIDLLIRPGDADRAADCVRALGFACEEPYIRGHFHAGFSKPLPGRRQPLTVELQWDLLMDGTSNFKPEPMWRDALPLKPYKHVLELSEYHTFYMICLHGWKHGLDSLKYLIDIVQLIRVIGERIDYGELFEDAKAHRTYRRLASTLSVVYRQFPFLEERKPLDLPKRGGTWWCYESIRGKRTASWMRYVRFVRYQWFDFDSPVHGFTASIQYLESLLKKPKGGEYHGQTGLQEAGGAGSQHDQI